MNKYITGIVYNNAPYYKDVQIKGVLHISLDTIFNILDVHFDKVVTSLNILGDNDGAISLWVDDTLEDKHDTVD